MTPSIEAEDTYDEAQLAPIRRTSLHDQVVQRLRDMILDGDLPAGDRVAEKRLCEILGVSRTPLREALKVLAAEGLVTLRPNRGAVVSSVTRGHVAELFPLCAALERLAAETACAKAAAATIDGELVGVVTAMRDASNRDDATTMRHLIHLFRQRLMAIAGNATLAGVHHALSRQAQRACAAAGPSIQTRIGDYAAQHEHMLDLVKSGHCEAFARLLHDFRITLAGHVGEALSDEDGAA